MSPINKSAVAHNEELVVQEEREEEISSSCSLPSSKNNSDVWEPATEEENEDETSSFKVVLDEKKKEKTKETPPTLTTHQYQTEQKKNGSANNQAEMRSEFKAKQADFHYLLEHVTDMILDYYQACGRPTQTQLYESYITPREILEKLGKLGDSNDNSNSNNNDACLQDIRVCFQHSLKTMHPFFLDKLYFGSDPIGQIAELVVAVLNTNTHVYHVSPVLSVMEVEVIQFIGQQFGFQPQDIDGTLNPGGSMSNMMALLLARHEKFPHVKQQGWNLQEDRPVAFTAVQSHYSIAKAAMVTGMGTDRMIQVPALRTTAQMDPIALEMKIQQEIAKGNKPFFVNALAGSTVMGAFDDLQAIGKICKKYDIWFHVDACWGGILLFASDEQNQAKRFKGVKLVDSISFNAHKGLGVVQQCAMLITHKKKDALRRCNNSTLDAEYLFQPQNNTELYDLGNKTLGCGRKADALKLWLAIRKHGLDGFRTIADNELEKAAHMTRLIRESDDFEMVMGDPHPMGTNVCYWYTPRYFQENPDEYTDNCKTAVHKLIFTRMKQGGRCLIQQNPLTEFGWPNFFRLALGADKTRKEDMAFLLEETRRLGQDITPADVIIDNNNNNGNC